MPIQNQRCLVTGAAGFIGSHLVERLVREGANVRAFVHYGSRPGFGNLDLLPEEILRSIDIVEGDVTDGERVSDVVAGSDVVFHLAATISIPHSYHSPDRCFETNAGGTLAVLHACRRHGVARLVHTSTSEVYGSAQRVPMCERHPLQAQSPYAASKIAADALVEAFRRSFDLPATTIRPFNTYGPRQTSRAVIPSIVSQLVLGADQLAVGDLRPTRDFVHVEDTVAGFVAAAQSSEAIGGVFNLATGHDTSIGDLARAAMRLVGREIPIVQHASRTRPPQSEVDRLCGDATAALDTFDWRPRLSLEVGLETIADFIRAHPERFRPQERIS